VGERPKLTTPAARAHHPRRASALWGACLLVALVPIPRWLSPLAAPPAAAVPSRSASSVIRLTVGPAGRFRRIATAVMVADRNPSAGAYYDIEVAPGTYSNDFPDVTRPMTIEVAPGHPGARARLVATLPLPNQKGIILTTASLTVDGLEFEGAHIADALGGNGAGIRDQNAGPSAHLIVDHSSFVDNQEGILQGEDFQERIEILNSRFTNNGNPAPAFWQHAIYVNHAASLLVDHSLVCGQLIGHDIKSRAEVTTVANSRLYIGAADPAAGCRAGSASYGIDAPNGGQLTIRSDQLIQGPRTGNSSMVAYGEEGVRYAADRIVVSHTDFSNTAPAAIGIFDPHRIAVELSRDRFTGVPTEVSPSG